MWILEPAGLQVVAGDGCIVMCIEGGLCSSERAKEVGCFC